MTYQEIIDHPQFKIYFDEELKKVKGARDKYCFEHSLGEKRLKSTPYSRLKAEGKLTFEWLTNEFDLILRKKSEQPVHIRDFVMGFIHDLSLRVIVYVNKNNKTEI